MINLIGMLKKALLFLTIAFISTSSFSQKKERIKGDRNVTPVEIDIDVFSKIVVGEDLKIDLIEGSRPSIFIEADNNLHDIFVVNVVDSVLTIQTNKNITARKKLNIKVTYTKALNFIETFENGEISSLTSINLDELTLHNSGSSRAYLNLVTTRFKHINSEKAKVNLHVETQMATLELSENSKLEAAIKTDVLQIDMYQRADAELKGTTNTLSIRADNSTKFDGKTLVSTTADILCESNSDVYVQASEAITISATGNSELFLFGLPVITINKFTETSKLYKKEL